MSAAQALHDNSLMMRRWHFLAQTIVLLLSACGDGSGADEAGTPAISFPEDVTSAWLEMRDCRESHEHELHYIRVFASKTAEKPYGALSPDVPYPVDAKLVKVEYDDDACAVAIGYTAMKKLANGESPSGGDWLWQKLDTDHQVLESGAPPRCVTCHEVHCAPPYGYDLTCAEEL